MYKFCSSPWDTININGLGKVGPCLCNQWHTIAHVGNIHQMPLQEIVSSTKFNNLKQSIVDQTFEFCRKDQCYKLYKLDQLDSLDHVSTYPSLPTSLNLDIDRNCNLKCGSCRNENIYSKEINLNAQKTLRAVLEAYKDVDYTVKIYGDASGDVFASSAWKEFFWTETLPQCFEFCIQTNGNLVTKNLNLLDKLKDQIDIMIVSFDASTQETYKKVRGGVLDLVVDGVRESRKMGINVTSQFVVQYENYRELPDYIKLCKELGVSHIGAQLINRWGHMSDEYWQYSDLRNNPNVDYKFLTQALLDMKNDPQCGMSGALHNLLNSLIA